MANKKEEEGAKYLIQINMPNKENTAGKSKFFSKHRILKKQMLNVIMLQ